MAFHRLAACLKLVANGCVQVEAVFACEAGVVVAEQPRAEVEHVLLLVLNGDKGVGCQWRKHLGAADEGADVDGAGFA